jgi:hypothetical protein
LYFFFYLPRQCPIDLKEAVASIIFAAPRCADLAELLQVREFFGVKYGKEFVAAAAELRPDCCVNRLVTFNDTDILRVLFILPVFVFSSITVEFIFLNDP